MTAGLAAIFGIIDFLTICRVREQSAGWIHVVGNVTALVIAIINTVFHQHHREEANHTISMKC